MRIAFVAPECDPIVKIGGLADVVGSLPRALKALGHDVEVYLPRFGTIGNQILQNAVSEGRVAVRQFPLPGHATLEGIMSRGVPVHLVGCPELFEREPHAYGNYDDNPARYAFFVLAALEAMACDGRTPDLIHLHDWTTGLLPVYRTLRFKHTPLRETATFFTIHNIAHPGVFQPSWFQHLGLPNWLYEHHQLEFYGLASMLKAGLGWSTMLSTVSPTYAKEIQGPVHGFRMEGLLQKRRGDLVGILNGIDYEVWDPARAETTKDGSHWPVFDVNDIAGRAGQRAQLQQALRLNPDADAPIFGFVGRLDGQKGVEAILKVAGPFLARGAQIAILGDGADHYRNGFKQLAQLFPGRVGGALEFNALLAKRIYAGSDFFLMPSKFEPCGLAQMIACRYGSIPIVAWTGGLADTIRDADGFTDGNGFTFGTPATMNDNAWLPAATAGLAHAMDRALEAFHNKSRMDALRKRAMETDFSWNRPAQLYEAAFAEAIRREREHSS